MDCHHTTFSISQRSPLLSTSMAAMARSCKVWAPRRYRRATYASAKPRTKEHGEPSSSSAPSSSAPQPGSPCPLDTNYWHYSRSWPWWQQRAFIVPAGISFVVLANLLETPGLKTTLVASIPVALLWYVALYLVPKNFTNYCNQWASTHPEEVKRTN